MRFQELLVLLLESEREAGNEPFAPAHSVERSIRQMERCGRRFPLYKQGKSTLLIRSGACLTPLLRSGCLTIFLRFWPVRFTSCT
ncbi:hypothetical protein EBB07_27855 [Paenibacillaceae bacterium]|nr:hypothetical protein EBB07_27855 [Paenibacillaceae bacterium]